MEYLRLCVHRIRRRQLAHLLFKCPTARAVIRLFIRIRRRERLNVALLALRRRRIRLRNLSCFPYGRASAREIAAAPQSVEM